ncbi:hypothetical protein [Natronolimnohabitans innermongolicus]|uniref:MBL fold metallo-hydrolase n=1 Tax=Natronolimnohabitans innermongolicus JCM 12255 TaxID=1227499 RepID=L9WRY3_9EURY|nr:hypothetical protein [Natronolimnohabitans innermongolicus]ELY52235.1 hypothetical protein C493_16344 [Natronolimnohabitans innermongolicus JCM 12255]
MTFRTDERAPEFREIDRFDGGVGWIAHPDEAMQRASHALEIAGEVWLIDPVDANGLDELIAPLGDVAGVVVLLDRHTRDAETLANRYNVPVYLPRSFEGVSEEIDAPVARFTNELSDTGLEAHTVVDNRFWREVALYDRDRGTLVVPESVGTAEYFRAGDEPLGVHPMRRPTPPRDELGGFRPERILVGHGPGITADAANTLEETLENARRGIPRVVASTARSALPF